MTPNRGSLIELDRRNTVRDFAGVAMSLRAASDGSDSLLFDGYSCITGHWYTMYGGPPIGWEEQVAPGAFRKTLSEHADVVLLVNHMGAPLARTKSGTLLLEEDAQGEHVLARLNPADPDVQALAPKLERGDLDEMSFAFRVVRQRWEDEDGNEADPMTAPRRRILEVNQHRGDVAIVNYGANDATFGSLRTLDLAMRALRAGDMSFDDEEIARLLAPEKPAPHRTSLRLARAHAEALALRNPAA